MSSQVKIIGESPSDCSSQKALQHHNTEIIKGETWKKKAWGWGDALPLKPYEQLVFMNVHYIDIWIINNVLSHCTFNNLSSQQLTFLDIIETDFLRPLSSHKSLLSSWFVFLAALPPGGHITICFTPCCASVDCHATMKGTCWTPCKQCCHFCWLFFVEILGFWKSQLLISGPLVGQRIHYVYQRTMKPNSEMC